jgi:lysophospholipase L1-like esterase
MRVLNRNLLLFLAGCILALGILEIGARYYIGTVVPQLIRIPNGSDLENTQESNPFTWWISKPGINKAVIRTLSVREEVRPVERAFTVSTNSHRLRGTAEPPAEGRRRILAIGDSTTFGLGVDDAESWPARLEVLLNQQGPPTAVLNGGVTGFSAYQGLRFLECYGLPLRPEIVLATFGYNDAQSWTENSDLLQASLTQPIEPGGAPLKLFGFLQHVQRLARRLIITEFVGVPVRPRLDATEFRAVIVRMHELCAQAKAQLVLISWPEAAQVAAKDPAPRHYQAEIKALGAERGIPVIDLYPAFAAAPVPLFIDAVHANAAGCRIAAEVIAGELASIP